MDNDVSVAGPRHGRVLLLALLLAAIAVRLHHFQSPILDQHHGKQVFSANRARNIARSIPRALWESFDFLDEQGNRSTRIEEVPVYAGLLGLSYRVAGEHEWIGRAWNILASLVAILALFDLMRREYDEETGLIAGFLYALSPLMIFYGRAVSPDPWMLAFLLLCAASYRRYLDGGEPIRWLAATAACGLMAAAFKYYGLMVLIPLADMACRRGGVRACFRARFLVLVAVMILPIAAWILGVFVRYPNPTSRNPYFSFQAPHLLLHQRFFIRLTLGLFVNDFGPFATMLIAVGAVAAGLGKQRCRPLLGWTVMGLSFVVLLAPKFLDHDYYGLLSLPAAAGWGAIGWKFARGEIARSRGVRAWRVAAVLGAAAVVQSPWVMLVKYEMEPQHAIVADRIGAFCPDSSRVVVMGQAYGWPAIHYSGRLGWVDESRNLPVRWREQLGEYRRMGASIAAVYFDPSVPDRVRKTYRPMLETLPVLEHRSGPWFRRQQTCEYYILDLGRLDVGERPAPAGRIASGASPSPVR